MFYFMPRANIKQAGTRTAEDIAVGTYSQQGGVEKKKKKPALHSQLVALIIMVNH